MAVYKLTNCKQSGIKTLDEYVTELCKLSKDCEFDAASKKIKVVVDASPVGLGAILTQEDKVVAYASCSLSIRYSRVTARQRERLKRSFGRVNILTCI